MSKIAIIALKAVGGTALFAVSFIGFAKLNGVPLSSLPGIGRIFPQEPATAGHGEEAVTPTSPVSPAPVKVSAAPATPKTDEKAGAAKPDASASVAVPALKPLAVSVPPQPKEAHAGIFNLLDGDGLYTQDELRALADSLRAKNHEVDQRGAELDRREDLLADRLTALDERRRVMDEFAKQIDARERELKAREAEVNRDATSSDGKGGKPLPPADLSNFFADGETEVLVQRLAGFTPEEGAKILIKLPPTRAKELLDGLPSARWREFAEAYARAAQK